MPPLDINADYEMGKAMLLTVDFDALSERLNTATDGAYKSLECIIDREIGIPHISIFADCKYDLLLACRTTLLDRFRIILWEMKIQKDRVGLRKSDVDLLYQVYNRAHELIREFELQKAHN